jgi:hypothetical protein
VYGHRLQSKEKHRFREVAGIQEEQVGFGDQPSPGITRFKIAFPDSDDSSVVILLQVGLMYNSPDSTGPICQEVRT